MYEGPINEIIRQLEKLTTKRLIAVVLNLYYPEPVKFSTIVNIVRSIRPYSVPGIEKSLMKMKVSGIVSKKGYGLYTLTQSGLKYVRWLWIKKHIPTEVLNPAVHSVRVKQKVVKKDGSVEFVLL